MPGFLRVGTSPGKVPMRGRAGSTGAAWQSPASTQEQAGMGNKSPMVGVPTG